MIKLNTYNFQLLHYIKYWKWYELPRYPSDMEILLKWFPADWLFALIKFYFLCVCFSGDGKLLRARRTVGVSWETRRWESARIRAWFFRDFYYFVFRKRDFSEKFLFPIPVRSLRKPADISGRFNSCIWIF